MYPKMEYAQVVALFLSALVCNSVAQTNAPPDIKRLAWNTDSVGPRRFISVHGRRASIFGYPQNGLEVWAYPFQILRGFTVSFRSQGTTTAVAGDTLLRRIEYRPESVTRVYAGPDFIVHEKLFVPLDQPGAIVSYEVDSAQPLEIVVRFTPVLDLMWPASIGGQEALWDSDASGYVLSEPTHRFTAVIESPDIVAHDATLNSNWTGSGSSLAFTLCAGGEHKSTQFMVVGASPNNRPVVMARQLLEQSAALEKDARDHYSMWLHDALQVETPNADIDRALAWSEVALDQAWVCNSDLGCGMVAGYGPSRKARRPQYDWFFAGDGMVAVRGLLAAGQYDRAREELEFIVKYQNPETGMIWHELSQSARWLDWAKYPYMFLHVDLTFDFLTTIDQYFSATGDQDFVKAHWPAIELAHRYCLSLLDPKDGLPRIPSEKRGQREQEELADELTLSASWANASEAFADLASATGQETEVVAARQAAERAIRAIDQRYWDQSRNFWITGYSRGNKPLLDRGLGPVGELATPIFSPKQRGSLLDQISSADFQADWGTRGRASSASTYAPNSYASGSVWATGTASAAGAFWAEHRPTTALNIWNALVPWSSLDSLGHMHEALAGDRYHEELESVPEQTWSSSQFFSTFVNGLLGLKILAKSGHIILAPHLPPDWDTISVHHVKTRSSDISFRISQSTSEMHLELKNDGSPVRMTFEPELPLGATRVNTRFKNHKILAILEEHDQDLHARLELEAPQGNSVLTLSYRGGVAIIPDPPDLQVGEPSRAPKITGVHLNRSTLDINLDCLTTVRSSFQIRTPWAIRDVSGASIQRVSKLTYRVTLNGPGAEQSTGYQHQTVTIRFAETH